MDKTHTEREFATRLKTARQTSGLTQAGLSDLSGLSTGQIGHLESGRRLPSYRNLVKLWRALDVSGDYLLGGR